MGRGVRWREQFWLLPLMCAAAAAGLGIALTSLDTALARGGAVPLLFDGGPEGARALLSAIITSMISFTGLVFSITILVLQLTSGQFSPRVLRTFLRDRLIQATLGVFVATFVYAMLVLRAVRGTASVEPFVPQLAVSTAFGFVLVSVVLFLVYIAHIAQLIRVATIIESIGTDTRAVLERRHPCDPTAPSGPAPGLADEAPVEPVRVVAAARSGVVRSIDEGALLGEAERSGTGVRLLRAVGEFVPAGAAVLVVTGAGGQDVDEGKLRGALLLDKERSLDQDVGFGLRQLVDIAERALSPGVNDPTTAVQALDQIHDLLRRLAARPLGPRQQRTAAGRLAVVVPQPGFEDYLVLAVDEIARWGSDAARVQDRLRGLLRDLHGVALPAYRPAIARQLARWGEAPPLDAVLDAGPSDVGLRPHSRLTDPGAVEAGGRGELGGGVA